MTVDNLLSSEAEEVMRGPQAGTREVAVAAPLTTALEPTDAAKASIALDTPKFDIEAFTRDMVPTQRRYFLALAMGYSPIKAGQFAGAAYPSRQQWFFNHPEWVESQKYIRTYWQELAPEAFFLWTNDDRVDMYDTLKQIALGEIEAPMKERERALEFYFRMFPSQNPYKQAAAGMGGFEELMIRARRSTPQ